MRYKHILNALDEESLYSPAGIVHFAEKRGLLQSEASDREARKIEKLRLRIAMGRRESNYHFPREGDGTVKYAGQAPAPAWYGWRWKVTMD